MPSSLPRLRTDLIVRTQQTSHETSVIVKDPVSRKFFGWGKPSNSLRSNWTEKRLWR